ncbi:helix-turn-helix domain-containing protein [Enterococcus faecium]|uniref:helix-turn-helix domain-containing protein n=1 Tax=Enterococcus faecium TaxID=1352 RepID=UPI0024BA38B8|nr:helix-turn-helix domain-containing protein [Enterococcus faecium]
MYKYPRSVLKDFAKEQFTSVSTVFRYAKLLIPYFRRYHITFHPFQLELNTSEANIRSFFIISIGILHVKVVISGHFISNKRK